jgi:hypothetical protein
MPKDPMNVGKVIQKTGGVSGWYTDTGTTVIDNQGNVVAPVIPGDVALPNNQMLFGGVDNKAHAQAVSKDLTALNTGAVTVVGLQGNTVLAGPYLAGAMLTFDGTFWNNKVTSHYIVAAANYVSVGGAAAETVTVTGALTTDVPFVTMQNQGPNTVTIVKVIVNAGSITVTFSADPGAGTVISYQLLRASH